MTEECSKPSTSELYSDVTVITTSIPGRESLLARAVQSVYDQTVPVKEHIIIAHRNPGIPMIQHVAQMRNRALICVDEDDLVMFLDDDDYLLPDHVESLCAVIDDDSTIGVTWDKHHMHPNPVNMAKHSVEDNITFYNSGNCFNIGAAMIPMNMLIKLSSMNAGLTVPYSINRIFEDRAEHGFSRRGFYPHLRATQENGWTSEEWRLFYQLSLLGPKYRFTDHETYVVGMETRTTDEKHPHYTEDRQGNL